MEFVKFFHILGLMVGAAGGMGHMTAAIAMKRLGGGPPNETIKIMKPIFGMFGLIGILLLWLTGIIMTQGIDAALLGTAFYIKLLAAGTMLAINLWLTFVAMQAKKAGTPPPAYMDSLGKVNSPLALIALAIAIYLFG